MLRRGLKRRLGRPQQLNLVRDPDVVERLLTVRSGADLVAGGSTYRLGANRDAGWSPALARA